MDVSGDVENVSAVHGTDQSTLVADVTDVTDVADGSDNKICGHSLERAMAVCLSGTGGGPPQL